MLFLLRPRQTWMPYALPRSREQQDVYNQQLREAYASTLMEWSVTMTHTGQLAVDRGRIVKPTGVTLNGITVAEFVATGSVHSASN
jgi:hypothetical protein